MSNKTQIYSNLKQAFVNDRLHHAYIFSGPESPEKEECIQEFLAELTNNHDLFSIAPNNELALKKIKNGNHPDFIRIQNEESYIGVDDVRGLQKVLAFSPLEAKKRVVLISQAEKLNSQAANAILKILEEPPSHTMFFLLCKDVNALLPTIRSRCQQLRFSPIDKKAMMRILFEEFPNIDEMQMSQAVVLSGGSIQRARDFLQRDPQLFLQAGDQLLELWKNSPRVPSSLVKFIDNIDDAADVFWVIDIWELLLRDLLFLLLHGEKAETECDTFRVKLLEISKFFDSSMVQDIAEKKAAINRFRVYQEFNGNLKLDFYHLATSLTFSVGKKRKGE